MANLDPNRQITHVVIDYIFNDEVYSGSYDDCQEFIAEQPDNFVTGMYDIVPFVEEKKAIRRIAIIDHASHKLMVEDVDVNKLENEYGGDEQRYIDENYTFEGDYSWDWIIDTEYYPNGEKNPREINFEDMT